jgi:quinol monooxygenase YgiN
LKKNYPEQNKDESKLLIILIAIWQAICWYSVMILVIIRMKVLAEKRLELSQTITSLSGSIGKEKGCRRCDICQSIEDENRLFLLSEWDTQENLTNHLKSEHFKVLRGAMNLLQEPYERIFHTVFHPAGMD